MGASAVPQKYEATHCCVALSAEVASVAVQSNQGCCALFWMQLIAFIHGQTNAISL